MIDNYLENYKTDILISDYLDFETATSLSKKILERETYIRGLDDGSKLQLKIVNDGNITRYHSYYNLLDFRFIETEQLLMKIKEMVFKLFGWSNFNIKMWANIFRKGDYLGLHNHMDKMSMKVFPYAVSGHCFLYSSEQTFTTYLFKNKKINPNDGSIRVVDIPNKIGEISIFSSYVEHEFKQWNGDLRVNVAFDINNESDASEMWLKNMQFRYV